MKTCTVEGCLRKHAAKGLCQTHYNKAHRAKVGRQENPKKVACAACGIEVEKAAGGGVNRRAVCSLMCRYFLQFGCWQSQPWPPQSPPSMAATPLERRRRDAERRIKKAAAGTTGRTWYVGSCRECGAVFTSDQPSNATCSRRCARTAGRHRRRAMQRGAFVAPVYRAAIFERDKWTCQLCGKKIKRTVVAPHPLAPTIDHVIPLGSADRGTHEPANCQAAHFICNARKSAGGGWEQLALLG
jgi:5-methylcytosine-specific restriction endonuclease McrA